MLPPPPHIGADPPFLEAWCGPDSLVDRLSSGLVDTGTPPPVLPPEEQLAPPRDPTRQLVPARPSAPPGLFLCTPSGQQPLKLRGLCLWAGLAGATPEVKGSRTFPGEESIDCP